MTETHVRPITNIETWMIILVPTYSTKIFIGQTAMTTYVIPFVIRKSSPTEQGNSSMPWPSVLHPVIFHTSENLASDQNSVISYIFPRFYKDSHTHFYTYWTSGGSLAKGCSDMICPGFRKTSSSIAPGSIINPFSDIRGRKSYITIRVFKVKSSGDWHIHYGLNGGIKPVGYFPKSLIRGLINRKVEISFGGYVSHQKPQPSPPMGSGYAPASGNAASFDNIKLIDANGHDHLVNTNLPFRVDPKRCYPISYIDSGRFFYGGSGCVD
ncbi:hypothetical protein TRIUR3_33377 [Triticum urartu]|uniref:Neprosin PEP catalytic domain-containing protein n=2 Tax=Triticum urartu TaxID=4572 RepID=M7YID0_TRIUA|nr:hypothetical protein TRIUR3_33377 [Triticum urartu]